jgi:hypothetical protein
MAEGAVPSNHINGSTLDKTPVNKGVIKDTFIYGLVGLKKTYKRIVKKEGFCLLFCFQIDATALFLNILLTNPQADRRVWHQSQNLQA